MLTVVHLNLDRVKSCIIPQNLTQTYTYVFIEDITLSTKT